jgi:hypothetical protein
MALGIDKKNTLLRVCIQLPDADIDIFGESVYCHRCAFILYGHTIAKV